MQETILIVDDDPVQLDVLARYFENRGYAALRAVNGARALKAAADGRPALVITDVDMPLVDGFELCRRIKSSPALDHIPVIIMSGKKIAEGDMVSGYGLGADDYVVKPFSYPVLLAKARAVMRRAARPEKKAGSLKNSGLQLDTEGRSVTLDGKPLKLTRKEFDLLALLMRKEGRVLTFNTLLEAVWGVDPAEYNNPHTVKVHVSNLRKKLGPAGRMITAVAGHGYKFSRG